MQVKEKFVRYNSSEIYLLETKMDETTIQSGNECIVDKESHKMKNYDNAQDDIVNENSDSNVKILETDECKKENDKTLQCVIPKNNKIDKENCDNNDDKILGTDECKKENDKTLQCVIPKNNKIDKENCDNTYEKIIETDEIKKENDKTLLCVIPKNNKIDEENCNHNTSLEEINKHSERNEKNTDEINKVLETPNNCTENDIDVEDEKKSVSPITNALNNSIDFNDTVITTFLKSEEKEEKSNIIVSESVNKVKTIKKSKKGKGAKFVRKINIYSNLTEEELQECYRSERVIIN